MSSIGGPKITTSGLVLTADASDPLSFRGENTTNLMPTITSWGSYVTAPVNATTYDFPGSIGGAKTVKQSTGSSVVGGGGNYGGFYRAGVSSLITAGEAVTVSFWVRSLSGNIACRFSNQAGAGDESNLSFSFTATSSWTRVSNSVTLNLSKDQFYIWNANVASGMWQIADFQLEKKSYATTYTESSRGTTVAAGGGWADLTGNGNHGELFNGTREGPGYLIFDGVNDYLSIGSSGFPFGSSAGTLAAWCRTNSLASGFKWIVSYGTAGTGQSRFLGVTGSTYYFGGYGDDITATTVPLNTWFNIVGVYNGTTASMYVNGQLVSGPTAKTWNTIAGNSQIGRQTNNGEYWSGDIAQVGVYNRALTANEVLQNFNALRGRFGI